ncbi:MAG: trigger factor [Nocardioidaceae bacterium]|nr:trigger factor [Nocardioidaceae bacterium]MDQ3474979.1 trigger factor [Actinomycetota bacterium]
MKSAVETLNPTRVKLTVEVPFEELKPSLDAAYQKIGKQISVPGFRRGKVPAMVIDQRVGREAVVGEAVNDALPKFYIQALQDNDLSPLSQPELDLDEFEDGTDLSFTAELDVRPTITLPDYEGIEVEVDDIEVDDDAVDEQLELLRERFGSLIPVERAAADGDFVTIDLSAAKDGEPIEEAQATGMSYQVGRGTLLEGLDEVLEGMSAEDEKTFPSTLVGGEFKDQSVDVTVKVTAVKEQELPDLDDEFAESASEFDTLDELKADVRDRLTRGARIEQAGAARDAALEKLLTLVEIPLPDAAVSGELQSRRDSIDQQLAYAGITKADYLESEGQTEEEFAEELDKRVREAMAAQFLLDDIAVAESLSVEEAELTQHLLRRAQQSGQTPEQYVQHMVEHNHIPEMIAEVRRGKALAHIVESATVRDSSGNVVELRTLQPDGTYADPAELAAATEAEAADPEAQDAAPDEATRRPVDAAADF